MRSLVLIGLVGLVGLGCVDSGPGPARRKIDPGYAAQHVLTAVPPGIARWDVVLGDAAVVYLGNSLGERSEPMGGGGHAGSAGGAGGQAPRGINRPRLPPGGAVTITHYWKVLRPIGDEWRPFALVRGAPGSADFMNLAPTDMQIVRPPASWRIGEIIEDIQTFTLRPDWRSPVANVLVGLIEVGRHGTLDRMPARGPHSQDRAIRAAALEVDLSRAPPQPGTIHIPRAQGAIVIDGVAGDPGWAAAAVSPEFATGEGGPDPAGKATARMTWDDRFLYVFVAIVDSDIVTPYQQQDDPLWKADAVELFIDADGNRRGYIELQVNPANATFDSWFAGGRAPSGDEAWDSGLVSAVQLHGTTAGGDSDSGWEVELAIPWAAMTGADSAAQLRLPPRVGDRWRLNVVRVDKRGSSNVTVSSWNRITYGDFHALERMLVAVFADSGGSIVPAVEAAPP